jgi:N6-adenosine-specific RNA methylase IME4
MMHTRIPHGASTVPAARTTALIRYEQACRVLAELRTVDAAKDLRDQAEAMRCYARQAKNRELETDAAEIRLRAERRIGEMIAQQKATVGLAKGGQPYQKTTGIPENPVARSGTLADNGIDKNLAHRARKLAAVPEAKFEARLASWREETQAGNERVSLDLLREGDKAERRAARLQQMAELAANPLALPQGPFGAGIADPPWENPDAPIGFNERHYRSHYPTMSAAEVAALGVGPIFGPVAFLALWITRHHLAIGSHITVLTAWGFEPKTVITWDKQVIGLGNGYVRDRSEHIVLAVRGKPPAPFPHQRVPSLMAEQRSTKHSEKPLFAHEWIELWFSAVTKVELFARSGRKGWVSWGNQSEPHESDATRFVDSAPTAAGLPRRM